MPARIHGARAVERDECAWVAHGSGLEEQLVHHAEHGSVRTHANRQRENGGASQQRMREPTPPGVPDVPAEKPFNRWPLPDLVAVFLNQSDVPKLAASSCDGLLSGHPARNQLLCLFMKMFLDLLREIIMEAAANQQFRQPIHDSPCIKTREIPSSILSKRDTSFFKCFAPADVNL